MTKHVGDAYVPFGPRPATCSVCGHQHVGADHGGICIGCPCPVRSAAWQRDLATCTACGHIHSSDAMGGICIGCPCPRSQ